MNQLVLHWMITFLLLQMLSFCLTGSFLLPSDFTSDNWAVIMLPMISFVSNFVLMNGFFYWFHTIKNQLAYISNPKSSNKITHNVWLTVETNILMNFFIKYVCFKHKMVYHYDKKQEPSIICSIIFLLLSEEVLFYSLHYLMHTKYLKWIHKWHHEVIYPEPQHSIYCSPIEYLIVNMLPILLPGTLFNVNPFVLLVWEWIAAINTMNGHSNKVFKYFPMGNKHLLHHTLSNVNYGVLSLLDIMFRTNLNITIQDPNNNYYLK